MCFTRDSYCLFLIKVGWVHIKGQQTAYTNYYKKMKDSDKDQWPPRFWKFHLTTESDPPVEIAFTDARRFGRVRLVDCPGADIRKHSPLVENGPDPVNDLDVFTEDYLRSKMRAVFYDMMIMSIAYRAFSGAPLARMGERCILGNVKNMEIAPMGHD